MSDEHEIRQLIERWHAATKAGGVETVLSLITDAPILLTPGQLPMTKDGFAKPFESFSGRVRIESTFDVKEIYAAGDLAYCWSQISVVMMPVGSGEANRRSGYALTVFRKSRNGRWLLSRDANLMTA